MNDTFTATVDASAPPTEMTYDVLDRSRFTTLPDGSETEIKYDFGNDRAGVRQFRTTVTDARLK